MASQALQVGLTCWSVGFIKLKSMPVENRLTEAVITAELERILPELLGCLFDGVSSALARRETIEPPKSFRMIDAATWIAAAEPALNVVPGSLLDAIQKSQTKVIVERVEDNSFVVALRSVLKGETFEGSATKLLQRLAGDPRAQDRAFPQSPSALSKFLDNMKPAMEKAGITVTVGLRDHDGRFIRIEFKDGHPEEPDPNPFMPLF
jgi:hypothetical protein